MTEMTPERLAEIRERAMYATDGPWKVDESQRLKDASLRYVIAAEAEDVAAVDVSAEASAWRFHRRAAELDAAFIAHAREDVPALLAEVERLRAELAKPKGDEVLDWVAECAEPEHPDWYLDGEKRDCPTCAVETAETEVERLRAELADTRRFLDHWRASYERLSRQLLRRHHAWQSARRGRAELRDELASAWQNAEDWHETAEAARSGRERAEYERNTARADFMNMRSTADRLRAERDEAREQVKRVEALRDRWEAAVRDPAIYRNGGVEHAAALAASHLPDLQRALGGTGDGQ